ncbi:sodium:solute symporter family protein [Synechococcus sp. PCC 7336]|uniref:sodium:solute symporter family protein n=1 Tax=Synechococcus sp. PCC 7336 TaxID=195250 RepID=UPI000476FF7C|nr:sodium:solute symporter family protein [Synechococcus sp. PCC 7336]
MQPIDWLIVALYLVGTMGLGLALSRRASKSLADYFVSGRSLGWWLAGISMAATTFSIDTPLYIAGVVGSRGIAGNWEWWSFGVTHAVMIYVFARLWRRAEIVTDAELTELRYGGRMAAILRATKAFLFAVPINCIGIGYAMLAAIEVIDGLQLWQSAGIEPSDQLKLWSAIGISALVQIYAGVSGLWGVVATDFFQFFLALGGAIAVAIAAVNQVGGMGSLVEQVQALPDRDVLAFVPFSFSGGWLQWSQQAGITASTFTAYAFVQWWAFRRSDGGGEFIQRLAATRDEDRAEQAAWLFNVTHYVIRTWPWIVVALAALVLYPDLAERELGYPKLMLDFLPPAALGLVVASLLAAFMSTVSTLINWGASYLTNDLYARFWRPEASQSELVWAGRLSSLAVTALSAIAAFYATDVRSVFRLVIAIGTGPGLVLILRWFWWRINAAAELAAMVVGFAIGLGTTLVPVLRIEDFGWRLMATAAITAAIWLGVMVLTKPESDGTLDAFYVKVRPGGPGWRRQQQRTGVMPAQDLGKDLQRAMAALLLLFGLMFAVGEFLLLDSVLGFVMLGVAAIGRYWLWRLGGAKMLP